MQSNQPQTQLKWTRHILGAVKAPPWLTVRANVTIASAADAARPSFGRREDGVRQCERLFMPLPLAAVRSSETDFQMRDARSGCGFFRSSCAR